MSNTSVNLIQLNKTSTPKRHNANDSRRWAWRDQKEPVFSNFIFFSGTEKKWALFIFVLSRIDSDVKHNYEKSRSSSV